MRTASESARGAFRQSVQSIRERLLNDIRTEADMRYSLQAKDRTKIRLRTGEAADFITLESHLGKLDELVREKAYTTANRLAFLFMMEARGLRPLTLVLKGTARSSLRDNAEFFTALMTGADQGWAYVLEQVWDSLALDLPSLFARSAVMDALPLPGTTLVWLINEFARDELAEVWMDDTTPGWLYQYWNDPDRKAVDEKLKTTTGKVEAGELAHKTQLFTERYMVEWLVQNSLGSQWLALCRKKGWNYEAHEAGDFWKYYVHQELSSEAVQAVPGALSGFKILDPAMGSGHFLVYVFDFLFELYRTEAAFHNTEFNPAEAVDSILCNNLHGLDIDNRAVQIAAASLFVKAKEKAPGYTIRKLNLVATDLGLSKLSDDDPALKNFTETLSKRTGLPQAEGRRLVEMLKSADYMGSLLQVNEEIKRLATFFESDEKLESTIHGVLAKFIKSQDNGNDLGLHDLAEQLEKGLRLISLLGQQYDVIVANPPYLTRGKTEEKLDSLFIEDTSELYESMYRRMITITREHGLIGFVSTHNFMFLSKFATMREVIQKKTPIFCLAQLGVNSFHDVLSSALGIALTVFVKTSTAPKITLFQRIGGGNSNYDPMFDDKIPYLISRERTYRFQQERFADIPGSPMIYWWPEEFRQAYLKAKKLGKGVSKTGCQTCDNNRFLRLYWEVLQQNIGLLDINHVNTPNFSYTWQPYVMGAKDNRWYESILYVVKWKYSKRELWERVKDIKGGMIKNENLYFLQGIAFNKIGTNGFLCRLRKFKSVFDVAGSSIFSSNPEKEQVLLSSGLSGYVAQSLNPTINNQTGDIDNLPVFDYLSDWKQYLDRARALYDELFASTETNIEYRYRTMDSEYFEVEEARIRDEIDKELLARFSADTRRAIYEEIGESPFDYPATETIPADFNDEYLASDSVLDLAHKYRIHPDSILNIKNNRGLIHPAQRETRAFQHLSWAIGVMMGRFDFESGGLCGTEGADGPGIEAESPEPDRNGSARTYSGKPDAEDGARATESAGPQGLLYLSSLDDIDGLPRKSGPNAGLDAVRQIRDVLSRKHGEKAKDILSEIDTALVAGGKRERLGEWIRLDAFARHKEMYENRPIYFPLVSAKKNFFVWVNIHRWNDGTLNAILANYLYPDRDMMEARIRRLREDIVQSDGDKKTKNELENTVDGLVKLQDELNAFIALVHRLATTGPESELQEATSPFSMDLDDGVMVNAAALWELVAPLWKEPKKWWEILSKPAGKKDYDWSHLAMRYWPHRVFEKVKKDPSLAVAHSDYGAYKGRDLFRELHPEAAGKWDEQQGKKTEAKFVKRDNGELEF